MDQICSILCDNWETERYTDPVPFQNSFGMAKNEEIPIENIPLKYTAMLWYQQLLYI